MKRPYSIWIIAISWAFGLQWIAKSVPELVESLFVRPSGTIAAAMMSQSLPFWTGTSCEFVAWGLPIQVSPACSGFGFFSILTAALFVTLWPIRGIQCLWVLLCSWGITLGVNAIRIVASVLARLFGQRLLPDSFLDILHQATGTLVFMSALMLIVATIQHHLRHDRELSRNAQSPAA